MTLELRTRMKIARAGSSGGQRTAAPTRVIFIAPGEPGRRKLLKAVLQTPETTRLKAVLQTPRPAPGEPE